MIAHALTAILAGAQAVPPPPVEHEIMIIGRRLRNWRGHVRLAGRGTLRCVTDRSSTDVDVDRIGGDALVTCMTQMRPRWRAISDRAFDRRTRISMREELQRDLGRCATERRNRLIEELAERRFQAREAGR